MKTMCFYKEQCGFTLIELLITVGIMMILSTMAMPIYGNLQSATDLRESSLQVVQLFRKARTWSYNAYRDQSYGIYYDDVAKAFVLYAGDNYSVRDASLDTSVAFSPGVSISSSVVGGEIHFTKWTGLPDRSGHFDISHQSISNIRRIDINALGVVDAE